MPGVVVVLVVGCHTGRRDDDDRLAALVPRPVAPDVIPLVILRMGRYDDRRGRRMGTGGGVGAVPGLVAACFAALGALTFAAWWAGAALLAVATGSLALTVPAGAGAGRLLPVVFFGAAAAWARRGVAFTGPSPPETGLVLGAETNEPGASTGSRGTIEAACAACSSGTSFFQTWCSMPL